MSRDRRGARVYTDTNMSAGDLTLPRPYLFLDGADDARGADLAVIGAGVNVGTRWGDPFVAVGVELYGLRGSPLWRLAEWLDRLLGPERHGVWRPFG